MTVIRKGHAFEGQTLAVISSIKRRGVLLVLVILPNAGRSLIPAAWTDWRNADTSLSTDDIDRASSLGKLGDLLQLGKVIDALLSRTPESGDQLPRVLALSMPAKYLGPEQKAQVIVRALSLSETISDERLLPKALTNLLLHLNEQQRIEVFKRALQVAIETEWQYSYKIIVPLLAHANALEKRQAIESAHDAARRKSASSSNRVVALASLLPLLEGQEKEEAFTDAWETAKRVDAKWQPVAFASLGDHAPRTEAAKLMTLVLDSTSRGPRSQAMRAVTLAVQLTARIGGSGAVAELRRAIKDVCAWHP